VLPHAIQIGNAVRFIAWCGMLGTVAWFGWRYWRQKEEGAAVAQA
jgi:predicted negative regulator of RcsB-dependent stress response